MSKLWNSYSVDLTVTHLVAGIPSHEKPLTAWLEANSAPEAAGPEMAAMIATLAPDVAAQHSVVFFRDADGDPCYESRCLKAALKEAANVTKLIAEVKNYRARLAERVFVAPPLVKITTPIQSGERPISVMTAQGPRTSLKKFEYADWVPMIFLIRVLKDPGFKFGVDELTQLLEYASVGGIGSDRSQSAGMFQINRIEAVAEDEEK